MNSEGEIIIVRCQRCNRHVSKVGVLRIRNTPDSSRKIWRICRKCREEIDRQREEELIYQSFKIQDINLEVK